MPTHTPAERRKNRKLGLRGRKNKGDIGASGGQTLKQSLPLTLSKRLISPNDETRAKALKAIGKRRF